MEMFHDVPARSLAEALENCSKGFPTQVGKYLIVNIDRVSIQIMPIAPSQAEERRDFHQQTKERLQ